MATNLDTLNTIKSQILADLAAITLNPQPSYSLDGQSVSWESYQAMLIDKLERINQLIQVEGGPFELRTLGTS